MAGTLPAIKTSPVALTLVETNAPSNKTITWVSPQTGLKPLKEELDSEIYVPNGEASWMTEALATVFEGTVSVNSTTGISGYDSDAMYAMYQPPVSLPSIIASVANSFTKDILDTSKNIASGGIVSTFGSVASLETVLVVRWIWLCLPAAVHFRTVAFLTITISRSRRHGVNASKSSSFSFLNHGLDRVEDRAVALDRVSDMDGDAQGLRVRLRQGGQIETERIIV